MALSKRLKVTGGDWQGPFPASTTILPQPFGLSSPSKILVDTTHSTPLPDISCNHQPFRKDHPMTFISSAEGMGVKQSKPRDLYQEVTDIIIEQLEAGTAPWHKPWAVSGGGFIPEIPQNFVNGKQYRGVNILLLWCQAMKQEFSSKEWATFKQWNEKGETIRKGEKGSMVVYYDFIEKEQDNGELKKIPFLKSYVVFNRCQTAGYVAPEQPSEQPHMLVERIGKVDSFIQNTGAMIEYDGNRACYNSQSDKILMPDLTKFVDTETSTATEGFYSTLLHETVHWTGHQKRLNRKLRNRFGSELYAEEELVAELGAAFLCAELGITDTPRSDHASYIASWLEALKNNKQFIIAASGAAAKAVDYLQKYQGGVIPSFQ